MGVLQQDTPRHGVAGGNNPMIDTDGRPDAGPHVPG
jgi:hypothetical protein